MNKKKLTLVQGTLLDKLSAYISKNKYTAVDYQVLKSLCKTKSFDASFNALLNKNYLNRLENENKYYLK